MRVPSGVYVDLCLQRDFKPAARNVRAAEVGVADEEALLVVRPHARPVLPHFFRHPTHSAIAIDLAAMGHFDDFDHDFGVQDAVENAVAALAHAVLLLGR